ncbi:Hypothetical protein GLP15_1789 [Giardia lamblia P15]|uniref:Uncharacterized protein n=1 Tax=Giardia intestinalis (strain P15) TaxID=658858 RepID=E1F392_GIAIA|nr:Hypothetical protein GLP15_1789 [Giardia lamblia P15]
MRSSFRTAHSSVEQSAAVIIQAWLRGHRSRRETLDVWVSYLSSVKKCEGEKIEAKIRLPLLRHVEIRSQSNKQAGKADPVSYRKEKVNPYSICLGQRGQKPKNSNK